MKFNQSTRYEIWDVAHWTAFFLYGVPKEGHPEEQYYEVRGEREPLLMISGGNGDAGFYSHLADILADEYQLITYDHRGLRQ